MTTQEDREAIQGHYAELSDAEKKAFTEVIGFIRDNPGSDRLLKPAHEAGCKGWGDAFAYILDNYEPEPSTR